jgi:magnesium transporter
MIRSLLLTDSGLRRDPPATEVEAAVHGQTGVLWVDITAADSEERAWLADAFRFHQLAIDDCFNGRIDTPKIDDYRDYLFIVAQSVSYHQRGERLELTEIDMFLGPNYVVTVHRESAPVNELFHRACDGVQILERGADFLAHSVLDSLVDLLLPAVEEMDEALDDVERRILEEPDKRHLPEVLLLKRNALRLRRSMLPERDMVNRLSRGEFPALVRPEALIFFRDVYDHVVRVEEMLEGLRDMADSALNSYLSSVNNRMNEVMKTLSIVAAIFLPLTLIASVYGTNLDLSPGVEFRYGFQLMLASMVLVALGLIGYFKYRRWF